jgi:hypothetical protein
VTALADHQLRRPVRLSRLAGAVAIGIALAAITGLWAGHRVSPNADPETPATRVVEAGPARLAMPATWQPVPQAARTPGLDSQQLAVLSKSSELSTMAIVTFGTAGDRSLMPGALADLVDPPRTHPRVTSLAGHPAWTYRALNARQWNLVMDVTVLPTTAGMLALACASPSKAGPGCALSVTSVSLRGAAALKPSPSVALAAQLPAELVPLDHARVDGRAALSRARTPAAQAVALHRLADQHRAAADQLRAEFGTAARPLVAGLDVAGRAYAALGTAASDGSSARFDAAREEVRRAESGLGARIDSTREISMRERAAPGSTFPGPTAIEPVGPSTTQHVLVVLLLLGSCAAGFALSGPLASALTRVRRALLGAGRA